MYPLLDITTAVRSPARARTDRRNEEIITPAIGMGCVARHDSLSIYIVNAPPRRSGSALGIQYGTAVTRPENSRPISPGITEYRGAP